MRLITATALLALAASVTTARAADVEWKFYTYFAANDKPTLLHKAFAEDIGKASGGRFKINVFASGELPYKAADVLRDVPALNALSMPFSCTSMDKFYDKVAPAIAPAIDDELGKRFKVHSAMQWVMPPQQLWLTKPVETLDAFKNLKARSWNREQSEMMRLLGGSGVSITPAEVIPALQRKVVDGAFTAAVPALDWKFNEVTPYALMLNLTLAHQIVAVNQAALDKLPADLRQLLQAKSQEWAGRYRTELIQADKDARKILAERGVKLREVSVAENAQLQQTVKPIWQEWADKNGAPAKAMLDTAVAACN